MEPAPSPAPGTRPPPPWRATYRIQLTPEFGFAEAAGLVPYLSDLGVSHLYLSPILEAVAGSTHGYDGTDPTRVSEERGGEAAFRELAEVAHRHGLGVLVDIVPNHLAAHESTPWWADEDERARYFDVDPDTGAYRRFFDIDGLAGLRQEDPLVFEASHAKILELVDDGLIDGLRIDHPDGLTDPAGYLRQLRERSRVPLWVEKILQIGEELRPWPVEGTVGYEFANEVTALFAGPSAEVPLTDLYRELTGDAAPFDAVAEESKREQLQHPFEGKLARLAELVPDVDEAELARAVASLDAYRTYVVPADGPEAVDPLDRKLIERLDAPQELADRLLLRTPAPPELVTRFQQLTAPVMAKGVEDTAFYRSVRLLAHNEVGGDPTRFSLPVDAFHAACARRAERHPLGLVAGTTHDTKRSADTRARLVALTTMVEDTAVHLRRWFAVTEPLVDGGAPTPLERWFLFQILLGSWPITSDRVEEYLVKALREAGLHTTWADPDEDHEQAVIAFFRNLETVPAFWADFLPFAQEVAVAGEQIALGQTLLRATTPGVCDVYQGDESWFLSLVDPDVRRPIDREGRQLQLERVRRRIVPTRSTAKLHVLHHALVLRREMPEAFAGSYRPLEAGSATVAYLRGEDVLVVVPLRSDRSAEIDVPAGIWADVLTDAELRVTGPVSTAALVGRLGVGLWVRRSGR
ncbi:alpha-amylase family glycosyl hydrolase [Aquihabitans daechungensis]|uniref:alpha-amylase family glycosyl hydrolase n=1 Tax=Aquihabitans daechungensis TaxID=1052257 RepID=UPI003BA1536F